MAPIMVQSAHHHRPTLKQQNKPFKSKHATKSSIKEAAKGKLSRQSPKTTHSAANAVQTRLNRKNHAKQVQTLKRQATISASRIFNGADGAPRIVAVIPLTPDVDPAFVAAALAEHLDISEVVPQHGLWKLRADRFKTSLQFINVPYKELYSILDACRVADYVVFALSSELEVDPWGDTLLRILQAQGLPEVVTVVASPSPMDPKEKTGVLRSLLSFIQYFVPSQNRVFDLHASADKLNALRTVCEGKPEDVKWREGRPYLLAETFAWAEGSLAVTGVIRGSPLSANRLIHIPNHGDYQISKIMSAPLPRHSKAGQPGMDVEPSLLAEPDAEDADSLVSSNEPDDLANEQTWPTEEEMADSSRAMGIGGAIPDAREGTTPKAVRRVPKGTSEYQAAWIVDQSDGEDVEEDDRSVDEAAMHDAPEDDEEMVELADDAEMVTDGRKSVAFEEFKDLDMDEEDRQLRKWRDHKRAEEDDLQFPDEIDTPMGVLARTRFQRYRGLRSFRTSPWDPYENLPREYARIFQFEDFKRTERAVKRRTEEDSNALQARSYRVTVYLRDVPHEVVQSTHVPFTIFGLLQHEHKKSVLNFTVQRNTEYDGSVRSKDSLILCIGPRRLRVNPIYSQHTRGGGKGANNVHKFERYLRHGATYVATTYGPVAFGAQPCILLRETEDRQTPDLVAMGSFLNTDTTRIIAKRIVLSGHPFKVHRKTATVRYMFFNADDVNYYKPIQLHTKHGRTGHIKESLGTHGYYKAHFDGQVSQMDTVCMALYKRVYPKWSELWTEREIVDKNVKADDTMEE
ncbi:hypothetical protein PHLGIDRAFT_128227 [Phlebiopsis gigantea 11061_1 CR5-6]|uniref:Bms1-type G domain-containing protein n=1 Tax=Phlebiopsis gigantea (strain 11061_1 CR5-6) TaxID=745531 RepID=A0A0C3NN61_PHLG1|nr:hypothetical protein PHLGIDRAFT_128227 [Phlebiopsis gigantea 11061_1 CR5-6]